MCTMHTPLTIRGCDTEFLQRGLQCLAWGAGLDGGFVGRMVKTPRKRDGACKTPLGLLLHPGLEADFDDRTVNTPRSLRRPIPDSKRPSVNLADSDKVKRALCTTPCSANWINRLALRVWCCSSCAAGFERWRRVELFS